MHRRQVRIINDARWEIADELSGSGVHTVTLRWHLLDAPYTFEREAGRLTLELPGGRIGIDLEGPSGLVVDVHRGADEPDRTSGWMSLYYGRGFRGPTLTASGRLSYDSDYHYGRVV